MDNEQKGKLENLYNDHNSSVRKTLLGNSQPIFDEKVTTFFRTVARDLLQKVDNAELYNGTIEQYVESQMHVIESSFKNFTESHSDSPYSVFHYSTLQEFESTLEVLDKITASKEEQEAEYGHRNRTKHINLESQQDQDKHANQQQAFRLEQALSDLVAEIRSLSARTNNVMARSYEEKVDYFMSLARGFVEKSSEDFQQLLNDHTNEMYSQISQAAEEYKREFEEISGIGKEVEKDNSKEIESNEESFIQTGPELLDYFKSPDFDINKLTEEQQSLYISEYIFGDEKELLAKLTAIAAERAPIPEPPTFSEDISPFLDDTPILDSSVSPELRPLSPSELKSYNERVAQANKDLKEKQEKEKHDQDLSKLLDSLPEVFL